MDWGASAVTKAYSYLRFSTPEQSQGDSRRRQGDAARAYAAAQGLDLDEELTFEDLGVSAFHGKNVDAGRLGDFLAAVRGGLVARGSYLLVESLDRISRNKPRKAVRVLENLCEEGITVVTLTDGKAYTEEALDDDPMAFMWAFMVAIRANEESATKARRLKSAWGHKRTLASTKPLTARAPAWLRLNADRQWEVLEDRAATVRRIYKMAVEGTGHHAIAEALNREGIETFGDGKRKATHWHKTYVAKILQSPAVIGTMVPHVVEHEEGKKRRKPQEPVAGYYPAVVDRDLFERVQALRIDSRSPQRGRHADKPIQNIVGGLARCPVCDGTMTRVNKGTRAKAGKPYLVCAKAKAGAGCTYRAVPLHQIEEALRWHPADIVDGAAAVSDGSDLQGQRLEVWTAHSLEAEALENLLDMAARAPSAALSQRIRATEARMDELKRKERELEARIAATHGSLVQRRLEQVKQALEADPLDVGKANVALRQVLSKVIVDYNEGALLLNWLHGGVSRVAYDHGFTKVPGGYTVNPE